MADRGLLRREQCPSCGEHQSMLLLDLPYDSGLIHEHLRALYSNIGKFEPEYLQGCRYTLLECRSCTLIYQQMIPSDALCSRLYGQWIDPAAVRQRAERGRGTEIEQHLRSMWRAVSLPLPRKMKVLDYGMGQGHWCEVAQVFGHEVWGFDIENTRMDWAAQRGIRTLRFDEIPGSNFDFIHCDQVLEHVTDPLNVMDHLVAGLRPEGFLYVSVPNGRLIKDVLAKGTLTFEKKRRTGLNPIEPIQHINTFTNRSLKRLAEKVGLQHYRLPVRTMIVTQQDWSLRRFLMNLARPLLARWVYDDGTNLYFQKPDREQMA